MDGIKGLTLDYNESHLSGLSYAKNMILDGTFQNEKGNYLNDTLPDGHRIIGYVNSIVDEITYFFVIDTVNNLSTIYYADFKAGAETNFTEIPSIASTGLKSYLNFDIESPVTGRAYKQDNGNTVVIFTDNFNTPKILIFEKGTQIILNVDNLNDVELFSNQQASDIQVEYNERSGALEHGSYSIGYRYVDNDNTVNEVLNFSNVIPISNAPEIAKNEFQGRDGISNHAIDISFSNLDTTKNKLEIVAIHNRNGVLRGLRINSVMINNTSTLNYTFTGKENYEELAIEELLVSYVKLNKVKNIEMMDNRLYYANTVEKEDDYEALQGIANNITMKWKSRLTNKDKLDYDTSFQHGEIYAFYVRFKRSNGTWTDAYHICGRDSISSDMTVITPWGGESGRSEPRWKVYDTTSIDSSSNGVTIGTMGYWVNDNEPYPTNGNFPAGNVRHHRMPSLNWMKNNVYSSNQFYGATYIDKLTVQAINVSIPSGYTSYEILYAKRDFVNSAVIGTDLLFYVGNAYSREDDFAETPNYQFTGGNFTLASKRTGDLTAIEAYSAIRDYTLTGFGASLTTNYDDPVVAFHNPELLRNKPNIDDLYFQTVVSIKRPASTTDGVNVKYSGEGDTVTSILVDYANIKEQFIIDVGVENFTSLVKNAQYVKANTTVSLDSNTTILNTYSNDRVVGVPTAKALPSYLANHISGGAEDILDAGKGLMTSPSSTPDDYISWLVEIMNYVDDCYFNFDQQILISTGRINTGTMSGDLEGDCYQSANSMNLHIAENLYQEQLSDNIVYTYIHEGRFNMRFREENGSNGKFYPVHNNDGNTIEDSLWAMLEAMEVGIDTNDYTYSSEYSQLNEFFQSFIWKGVDSNEEVNPIRIWSSENVYQDDRANFAKIILANNYYDMPMEYGEIMNLQKYGDRLLIHQWLSLHETRSTTKLTTDIGDVTLGSGKIFDVKPIEILPSTNDAGTQHKHSCLMTKAGYVFINTLYGKVYLYNSGKLNEISNVGTKNFFRENLPFYTTGMQTTTMSIPLKNYNDDCDGRTFKIPFYYRSWDIYLQMGNVTFEDGTVNTIIGLKLEEGHYVILFETEDVGNGLLQCTAHKRFLDQYYPDNPFDNEGYAVGYDEQYNRIMITKKHKIKRIIGNHKGSVILDCSDLDYFDNEDLIVTPTGYKKILTEGIADDDGIVVVTCFGQVQVTPPLKCAILMESGEPDVIKTELLDGYLLREDCEI